MFLSLDDVSNFYRTCGASCFVQADNNIPDRSSGGVFKRGGTATTVTTSIGKRVLLYDNFCNEADFAA